MKYVMVQINCFEVSQFHSHCCIQADTTMETSELSFDVSPKSYFLSAGAYQRDFYLIGGRNQIFLEKQKNNLKQGLASSL